MAGLSWFAASRWRVAPGAFGPAQDLPLPVGRPETLLLPRDPGRSHAREVEALSVPTAWAWPLSGQSALQACAERGGERSPSSSVPSPVRGTVNRADVKPGPRSWWRSQGAQREQHTADAAQFLAIAHSTTEIHRQCPIQIRHVGE